MDPRNADDPTPRPVRKRSLLVILGPAAVVVLWVAFFMALGNSCVFKECAGPDDAEAKTDAADSDDPRNDLKATARAKVKQGDTLGQIAERFLLTEDELKACNPDVDPQALQPGTYLFVSGERCEEADLASVGANPDPLAGETNAGTGSGTASDPRNNGTAAADPSVGAGAPAAADDDQG